MQSEGALQTPTHSGRLATPLPAFAASGRQSRLTSNRPMFYVPLYLEGIRSRPALVFWSATLLQAALWLAVPMLFYAAPPGDLAQVLAAVGLLGPEVKELVVGEGDRSAGGAGLGERHRRASWE